METGLYVLPLALICHLAGDYYFQTDRIAENKKKKFSGTLIHGLIYSVPFAVLSVILYIMTGDFPASVYFPAFCAVTHFAVDTLKLLLSVNAAEKNKKGKKSIKEKFIFAADQIIHLALTVTGYLIFTRNTPDVPGYVNRIILYVLFILLLCKPANITLLSLFSEFIPGKKDESGKKGAGAMIGNMERIACGIFLIAGQYAAIGLVLTAKSIARYNKISEDKEFSEYYIIGTLFSLIYTVCSYYAVLVLLPRFIEII